MYGIPKSMASGPQIGKGGAGSDPIYIFLAGTINVFMAYCKNTL